MTRRPLTKEVQQVFGDRLVINTDELQRKCKNRIAALDRNIERLEGSIRCFKQQKEVLEGLLNE